MRWEPNVCAARMVKPVSRVSLVLEPQAAGTRFARTLTEPATVLIGDFGGGTSDFSLMHFEPHGGATSLGHAGIGIAGDVLDYRIIDRAIAPLLGKGDSYRVMGKPLPVPPEYHSGFARWHLLSLMRTPRTLRAIAEVARTAQHPERLRHLLALIEDGLGYALYQAVSSAKAELSRAETATLRFQHKEFVVERISAGQNSRTGSLRILLALMERWIRCSLMRTFG